MIDDREALYRTICENPDDDTPRLVYADWLQEHRDEPRAEFIRVQCRLEGMDWDDPEYGDLKIEEGCLLACHGKGWLPISHDQRNGVYWDVSRRLPHRLGFRRGFPDWPEVSMTSASQTQDTLREIRDQYPIQQIDLAEVPNEACLDVLRLPEMRHFLGLAFWPSGEGDGDRGAVEIAESELFANLRKLYLTGDMTERGLNALAGSSSLENLRELFLFEPPISHEGMREFLRTPVASRLRFLGFCDEALSDDLFRTLGEADLPGLRALEWCSEDRVEVGLRTLLSNEGLAGLASLKLDEAHLSDDALTGISSSTPVTPRELWLREVQVTGGLSADFIRSPAFRELQWLQIRTGSPMDTEGIIEWASGTRLRRLELGHESAPFRGIGPILGREFAHLAWLSFSGRAGNRPPNSDELVGLDRFVMPAARYLHLQHTPIGDRGAAILAENGSLARLRVLELPQCGIGDQGALALVESPHLAHVERIDLSRNPISEATRTRLSEHPGVTL